TALSESLSILRSHADRLRRDADEAMIALDDLRGGRRKPRVEAAGAATDTPSLRGLADSGPDPEQREVALLAQQRVLDDFEALRRRRLSELEARLAEQRSVYTDNHPTIGDLRATIAALSAPSPEHEALREEVASLRAQVRRIGAGGAPGAQLGS